MKKILFGLMIMCSIDSNATHTIGGEISYQLIDRSIGRYKIKLVVFRDCVGTFFGNEVLNIHTSNFSQTTPLIMTSSIDATSLCSAPDISFTPVTNCPSGPIGNIKGIHRTEYEATYTIGKNIGWAVVGWSSCCRNNSISTISPTAVGIWAQAAINTNYENNSPVFNSQNLFNGCQGQKMSINPNAEDIYDPSFVLINGHQVLRDSFGYQIVAPFANAANTLPNMVSLLNMNVFFVSPLNAQNFLFTMNGGVNLDNTTGTIDFTPSIQQEAISNMIVKEYRAVPNSNGLGYTRVYIGHVMKEMQFLIKNCSGVSTKGIEVTSTQNLIQHPTSQFTYIASDNLLKTINFKIVAASSGNGIKLKLTNPPLPSTVKNFVFTKTNSGTSFDTIYGTINFDTFVSTKNIMLNFEAYFCNTFGQKLFNNYSIMIQFKKSTKYCTSSANLSTNHDLTEVNLNAFQNIGTCNSLVNSSTISATGTAGRYSDWTNANIALPNLVKALPQVLTITLNNCGGSATNASSRAFIDWNHDFDFDDALEAIDIHNIQPNVGTYSVNFSVPIFALIGNTRLRIVSVEGVPVSSVLPCGTYAYGETEDYQVNIVDCNTMSTTISSSINSKVLTLTANSNTGTDSLFRWKKNGVPITSFGTSSTYIDTNFTASDAGTYCIEIIHSQFLCTSQVCTEIIYSLSNLNCTNQKVAFYQPGTPQQYPSPTWNSAFPGTCYPNPFIALGAGNSSSSRYIYTKAELEFMGMKPGYILKSIAFKILQVNINNISGFQIKIGQTTNIDAKVNNVTLYTVYPTQPINLVGGWNDYIFSQGITWDGVSNLLIETHTTTIGTMTTPNFIVALQSFAGINSAYKFSNVAGVSAANSPGNYISSGPTTSRPHIKFEYCDTASICNEYKNFKFTGLNNIYSFKADSIPAKYSPSYFWTFGNGKTSTLSNPTDTFLVSGTYTVKLVYCLRDTGMNIICCDSIFKSVIVDVCNTVPNFSWTIDTNSDVRFLDSTTPPNSMYSYHWTYSDSTSMFQKNPKKNFPTNGTYNVCLKVKRWSNSNNQICEAMICKSITLTNVPPCNRLIPNFKITNLGNVYTFSNLTNMSSFGLISINFTTSDGGNYSVNNATHSFANSGVYGIVMTIVAFDSISGTTCTKSISKSQFIANSVCGCLDARNTYTKLGMTVHFINTSVCTDTATTYLYNFGNGSTSSSPNPSYTYPLPGLYRVVMYVTRTIGAGICIDSTVKTIQIVSSNPCKDSGYTSYITCPQFSSPLCGCDSITYQNYCFLGKAGVKQFTNGPCPWDTNYVKICGNVYHDINRNCIKDSNDLNLPFIKIQINTTPPKYAYTNSAGFYQIWLPKGTYTLTQIVPNIPFLFNQSCPTGAITVNANPGGMTYCGNDFYDTTNTCPDLAVQIFKIRNITPGFISKKQIKYQNRGATTIHNVKLHYRFLSSLIVQSTTNPSYTVSGNVITWSLGSLPPYTIGYKQADLYVPVTTPLGTKVIDSAWIEPDSGDCNLTNNNFTKEDSCVGSYDPNDKSAAQASNIDTSVKTIDYHVRFQNTGTAPAYTVLIEDQIDNNYDLSTLQFNGASHSYNNHLDDNRKLFVEFPNIMLPDSGTDFEKSQGYISYSIQLKKDLPVGTQFKNTALIFFDFNDAIITNTTTHTIVLKTGSGVQNQGEDMNISIYPNPTSNKAYLKLDLKNRSDISYSIYDVMGKMIHTRSVNSSNLNYTDELNFENLSPGIYILNININGKESSFKIQKE